MAQDTPRSPEVDAAEVIKLGAEAEKLRAETAEAVLRVERARIDLEERQRSRSLSLAKNSENRVYDFVGNVSETSAEAGIDTLSRWVRQSSEPITVRITSSGGSVIAGMALFDTLRAIREDGIHLTTVTLGWAASMGGILLQAGTDRVIGPGAWILIHEAASGSFGKLSEIEDEAKFLKRMNDRLFSILAERSKMSKRAILARAKRRDWWLDDAESLKLGFADRIGYR